MWDAPPEALIETLQRAGSRRAFVITQAGTGRVVASHERLAPLASAIAAEDNFDRHQGCFFEIGAESGHLLSAFVHATTRGQAAGGVRFWRYERLADFIRDGLRLSKAMGQKCALAGLWWGGGKGVIARRADADHRDAGLRAAIYRDYGRLISSLCGCYVTAEDVGTTPEDMARIFSTTRHTSCIPPELGGSGNPSRLTAAGVVVGMEAALHHLGAGTLADKTVAMQGLGNVSQFMIGELVGRGVARVIGVDVDEQTVRAVRQRFDDAPLECRHVADDDLTVFAEDCDVLAPNAVGAVLSPETIPTIRTRVVCGGANNQLAQTGRDGRALADRGILYVPDFLCNRMGIVNCANEQYGSFESDPAIEAHLQRGTPHGIFRRSLEVFERARRAQRSTAEEAEALADELARQPHPIWPGRGQRIIDHLVASGWASQPA
jgi:glutamate dehydrogenase/leucine dehydrogenase